jgi:hypothetical protein
VDDRENDMNSNTSLASGHGRGNRLRRGRGLATVVMCVAVFAAACGGPGGSANPGSGNGSGLNFSECMRAHGVSNFPNPSGGQVNLSGINQNSPQFQHAAAICGRSGGDAAAQEAQALAKALAFSRCMRAHGLPNYPDPTVSNGSNGSSISSHISSGSGVDRNSPVFQAAARACRSLLLGGGQHGSGGSA